MSYIRNITFSALLIRSMKTQTRYPTSFLPLGFSVTEFDPEVGDLPEIIPLFSNAQRDRPFIHIRPSWHGRLACASESGQKERSPSQTNYPSSSDFTGGRPEITINPTDSRVMCGRRIPAKTASLNKLSVLISSAKTDAKSCSDLESRFKRNCN